MNSNPYRTASIFFVATSFLIAGCGSDSSASPSDPVGQLITNGNFESPMVADTSLSSKAFLTYDSYSNAVLGWTISGVDLVHRMLWPAASGNQSIDLNSSVSGRIARRVDTKAGATYTLSFSIATNPASDYTSPETRMCRVLWNQVPVETLSVLRVSTIAWKRHERNLVAKGNDSLQIESITVGRAGVTIDSVSLLGQ